MSNNTQRIIDLGFRVDTPRLLREMSENNEVAILKIPLNILQSWIYRLAERAIELDDPELNIIMLSMSLYEGTPQQLIQAIEAQFERLNPAEVESHE